MQPLKMCPHCNRHNTKSLYCKTKKGFDRYECLNCNKAFCETTGSFFFKTRNPVYVIIISIILCCFMRTRNARLIVYLLFRVKLSTKSMNKWTGKYLERLPNYYPRINLKKKIYLILHADEKFVKINGKWHYWWSVIDNSGNLITGFISKSRDLKSAKKLFKDAKISLQCKVDFVVTDKLQAYIKAKNIFGSKCKHIQTGIKGTIVNPKGSLFRITNNRAEGLNSEIDIFLSRFRYNFRSLESARRWMKCFMFCNHLLRMFEKQCDSEAKSKAGISIQNIVDPIASFQEAYC